jgi:hypothetical protein
MRSRSGRASPYISRLSSFRRIPLELPVRALLAGFQIFFRVSDTQAVQVRSKWSRLIALGFYAGRPEGVLDNGSLVNKKAHF